MSKIIRKFDPYLHDAGMLVKHKENESIIVWKNHYKDGTSRKYVFGLGNVRKIEKGKDFDIVVASFGCGDREIICRTPLARRMLYTLTINQYASFYGNEYWDKDKQRNIYVAIALQGWFVPKAFDRENSELEMEEMSQEEEIDYLDFLNNL